MSERPDAIFLADSTGIDFLNSIANPSEGPVEWLADGAGLIAWLRDAGLVSEAVLADIVKHAKPAELDKVAAEARELREWFRGFVRLHMGKPLGRESLRKLDRLNKVLARDERFSALTFGESGVERIEQRHWRSAESLLLPIAEAMAKTIATEDFAQLKACEGADCTLMFADHTRGHARRWCSMKLCGNRAKVAAHRTRAKLGRIG